MTKYFSLKSISILAVCFFTFISCSHNVYTSPQFESQTASHKIIAVLPAKVILTGTKPKKMTDADIAKQENAESILFQESLFSNILKKANTKKYYTNITLQPLEKTKQLLSQQNDTIDYRNIDSKSDEELCKLLGVDAVVRLKVQKTRYMSGLVSFGADLLNDILMGTVGVFVPGTTTPVPNAPTKTDDIIVQCSIQSKGQVLWNDRYSEEANWKNNANTIVDNITNYFGRKFPYKKKKGK